MLSGFTKAQEIDFGVRAGVNFSNLIGDGVDGLNLDSKLGLAIGVTGEYQFNEDFGLNVGLTYSERGWKEEALNLFGQLEEGDLRFTYLTIPILAKYYIGDSGFSINAGPQAAFNISRSGEVNGEEIDDDFIAEPESIDVGLLGGVSYKFMEGSSLEGFLIDARYNYGLTEVFEGSEARWSILQLSVGYVF